MKRWKRGIAYSMSRSVFLASAALRALRWRTLPKAAGVTRGAIYWHFADKADLFCSMVARVTMPDGIPDLSDRPSRRRGPARQHTRHDGRHTAPHLGRPAGAPRVSYRLSQMRARRRNETGVAALQRNARELPAAHRGRHCARQWRKADCRAHWTHGKPPLVYARCSTDWSATG